MSGASRYEWAWLIALSVLVLNDHWLKGSGRLPGVVTGKLSDFAGLFVAPVLLSVCGVLVGWRGFAARVCWFALVGVGFAAIKLNANAARALQAVLGACGVPSRIWSDPWDLLALMMLPLAWRAVVALEPTFEHERPRWPQRVAVGLGALGCIATSEHEPYIYSTSMYLVNLTPREQPLTVLRVTAELDCADLEAAALAADFSGEFCETVVIEGVVPLDRDFVGTDDGHDHSGATREEPACDAVVLRGEALADVLVFWQASPNKDVNDDIDREAAIADPDAVVLEEAQGNVFATGSPRIRVVPWSRALPAVDCKTLPSLHALDPGRAP